MTLLDCRSFQDLERAKMHIHFHWDYSAFHVSGLCHTFVSPSLVSQK
jgi:hypothetical protein